MPPDAEVSLSLVLLRAARSHPSRAEPPGKGPVWLSSLIPRKSNGGGPKKGRRTSPLPPWAQPIREAGVLNHHP
ncbi:MAG: hypothetical protein MJE68_26445 [Proteobacteria bacterium]|nr:hypothetical protein [Pseudomonadota bacterium]